MRDVLPSTTGKTCRKSDNPNNLNFGSLRRQHLSQEAFDTPSGMRGLDITPSSSALATPSEESKSVESINYTATTFTFGNPQATDLNEVSSAITGNPTTTPGLAFSDIPSRLRISKDQSQRMGHAEDSSNKAPASTGSHGIKFRTLGFRKTVGGQQFYLRRVPYTESPSLSHPARRSRIKDSSSSRKAPRPPGEVNRENCDLIR